MRRQKTILFVDEIHRFNKAQQDAFLPHVEKGTVILVGATTENPSFEVVAPLLSRSLVPRMRGDVSSDSPTAMRVRCSWHWNLCASKPCCSPLEPDGWTMPR
jgi:replication-associated recombination protein RarA